MRIGIPKENNEKETRVAIVPVSIPKLIKLGFEIVIEKGAGEKSGYSCLLYTSPSPRDRTRSRMPSSA